MLIRNANAKDAQEIVARPIEMAGSKQIRRKRPADVASDLYWFPWTVPYALMVAVAQVEERRTVNLEWCRDRFPPVTLVYKSTN